MTIENVVFPCNLPPNWHVTADRYHVCASHRGGGIKLSLVEADSIDGVAWDIARAKVADALQGKGIGSKLLQYVIQTIKTKPEAERIQVCPGGYSDRLEDQCHFYEKNGFACVNADEHLYEMRLKP